MSVIALQQHNICHNLTNKSNYKMARQQQDLDELFDIKNTFYVGNFQQCINEAQRLRPSSLEVALERDAFLYRAYIAQQNYRIVIQELDSNVNSKLLPLKSLAEYISTPANRPAIVATIDEQVNKGTELTNEIFLIAASTIYYHEDNLEAALRILHGAESLECRAFTLQILLSMHRLDLAKKQLKLLQEIDDMATLTQLAQTWLNLAQGGPGIQDAHYTIAELTERLGSLGPGPAAAGAAAHGARGMWSEAEQALTEAQGRAPRDADLLVGLAVAAHHEGKASEVASRYLAQLIDSHPNHQIAKEYLAKESEFKRLTLQYQPSVVS